MKIFLKILAGIIGILLLFAAYIQFIPPKQYDIAYPAVNISTDSTILARGEYLIYGSAHCSGCHSRIEDTLALRNGEKVPLAGGKYFDTPLGRMYIPNLTPHETGIANLSNGEIARAMRYSVNHEGRAMIPVMPFTHMSEDDISAIISYLRAQLPVENAVPTTDFTFLGKIGTKYLLKPYKQTQPILKRIEVAPTVEYGEYLVKNVANCAGCHTAFDIQKMEYTGIPLSGGMVMEEKEHIFIPPNLTPDPKTGHIFDWTEERFVDRFKAGATFSDTPMPWIAFQNMSKDEIRAIYKYLKSIPPTENELGPIVKLK